MLTLKKVAVTGLPSTGKTSFCKFLQSLGSYVIEADEVVHELYTSSAAVQEQIMNLLGEEILVNGAIEKKLVAKQVFSDPKKLQALEKILHPLVLEKIIEKANEAAAKKAPLFVAEIPLLYEAGFENYFDYVVVVSCKREKALNRFSQKNPQEEYRKREMRFTSSPSYFQDADTLVENNGTLQELEKKAKKLFNNLKNF